MLYSQVPVKMLKKVSTELKLDLKLASLLIKNNDITDSEYAKIVIVRDVLTKTGTVGTIQFPQTYVSGDELAQWALVAGGTVIWLVKRGATLLVMTGSAQFLVGDRRPEQEFGLHSYAWSALNRMMEDLDVTYEGDPSSTSRMLAGVAHAQRLLAPFQQRISFLAVAQQVVFRKSAANKSQQYWDSFPNIDSIILGSPIYVSLGSTNAI
ncbi:hypothetical protein AS189_09355 [Arthrobacter alpinus]|uniref:Uncharacterized protein n=2 Tax=Arthrobacter alpinus TaxID=656366 RepID=A0A0S2LYY7_9MICC|nr:hypothetical protein AS189_09355 [Arthrobacter alpinus]